MGHTPLTLNDWITSSGSYPDRANSAELTAEIKANAGQLLKKVNALLTDVAWGKTVKLSSGFRPSSVNSALANSAKKSAHCYGSACDLIDDSSQTLGKILAAHPDLLRKHGLFLEALTSTRGQHSNWCHLDCVSRADRPSRIFQP